MAFTKAITVDDAQVMGDGSLLVIVQIFGDAGEQPINRTYAVRSLAELQAQVAATMANLNQTASDIAKIAKGTSITAPTATVPTPPTPEQQFFADYSRLLSVQRAVDMGIINAGAKEYTDLVALVKSEYSATFVADGGWPR